MSNRIVTYESFSKFLNEIIFGKSKLELLEKLYKKPERFIGIFRPTKPKGKVLQHLLTSQEIKFGNAMEHIITEYLRIKGVEILPNKYQSTTGKKLDVDICFKFNNEIFVVELKIRDDHDTSKKVGQAQNFEQKIDTVLSKYNDENSLIGVFYFVDPSLTKNAKYYREYFNKTTEQLGVKIEICYGKEFFTLLIMEEVWDEICEYLIKWKEGIPELPEVNFDLDAEQSFNDIKDFSPMMFLNLFENEEIFNEIILTIFPQKKTLFLLNDYFKELSEEHTRYKNLYQILNNLLN